MSKVKVKVPGYSGFRKSFQNLLTSKVGTITPILIDEIVPNTKISLKDVISASLPPLASDTFMRCNLKVEAFFIPMRLLYGGFEDWLTGQERHIDGESDYPVSIPSVWIPDFSTESLVASGTLADYLGVRIPVDHRDNDSLLLNILPFLAYHRVYHDWYRNPLIQKDVFYRPVAQDSNTFNLSTLPYASYVEDVASGYSAQQFSLSDSFYDGVKLGELRQRNFGADYFTTSLPDSQLGKAKGVVMSTIPEGGNGFTIAALRMANSLQQFAERNQLAGPRLQDFVRANYGADLSSGVAQRSIVLGSAEIPVYSKGIYSQTNNNLSNTQNPFGQTVGAEYGSASAVGTIDLVNDFTAAEPGYLLVNATLVPKVTYSSGIHPLMTRYCHGAATNVEMATPLLENTGFEKVKRSELTGQPHDEANVFGYVQRYASFKTRFDELHGLLRDGETLQSFALQRTVLGAPTISSDFLQIPTDFLDQVAAVKGDISKYGVWIDCFHDYNVAMPLSEFSIPSLQDPAYEHGRDVELNPMGQAL